MQAEIVSVGTELLLGNIVDTNAAWLARRLAAYGVDAFHQSTVGDNLARCAATIRAAWERSDAVIVTGGIGPTPDDCTREAIAVAMGVELARHAKLVEELTVRYAARGRTPTASSLKQAEIPVGGEAIPNPVGSAPGVLFAHDGKVVYAMPGVPSEMYLMADEQVLPDLRRRFGLHEGLFSRVLHTRGVGESTLAAQLQDLLTGCTNPTVATYVKTGEVEVRLTARAEDQVAAQELFEPLERLVRERIGLCVFGVDQEGLEANLGTLLRHQNATIATAESCTGGQIGDQITSQPGSSEYYLGGVVAYHNQAKLDLLGVPADLLASAGAVSPECAMAMARGVAERFGADYGLASTGIAGPGGGTAEKPVGLVHLACWRRSDAQTAVTEHRFAGDRAAIKERTTLAALELACQQVAGSKL